MTHTSTEQPEALRLANWLDTGGWPSYVPQESAAELRRLHARVQELEDQLKDARHTADFYKQRCNLLQAVQSRMRDPERTVVCDILANGQLLQRSDGAPDAARYGDSQASQAQHVPLSLPNAATLAASIKTRCSYAIPPYASHVIHVAIRETERAHGITQEKQG